MSLFPNNLKNILINNRNRLHMGNPLTMEYSSMKTVRRVSNRSNSSSKSLGLCGASVFSLVWLGDRLVRHLASTSIATKNSTMMGNQWSMSNKGSMVSNERGMGNNWDMVDKWRMVNNRGMSNYSSWSIAWNTFIGDILDIS